MTPIMTPITARRVVVTGGAGFLGQPGVRALRARGCLEISGERGAAPMASIPGYAACHRLRPGRTRVVHLYAPRNIPPRQTCTYAALSRKQQRVWLDLKLIALSCWITVRGTWEDRGKTC